MTRSIVKTAGSEESVEVHFERLEGDRPGRYAVHLAGCQAEVEFDIQPDGSGTLLLHGRLMPFFTLKRDRLLDVWLDGRVYTFEPAAGARRERAAGEQRVTTDLTAPMPGTILAVKIAKGQRFEAHQPLIVMESMKMEMVLSAPHAGTVREVLCREGQLVEMNALLVKLSEPQDDAADA